jgi:hypothetical protein
MALLGHAATYIVSSPNPHASAEAWGLLGFDDAGSDASIIRMTDGQIFISIIPREGSGLSLAYFAPSLQSVRDKLVAANVELTGTPTTDLCVHGCSTTWWIHTATPERMQQRTGEGSPLLGYFDALVLPVNEVAAASEWIQRLGYILIDIGGDVSSRIDCTDGLVTLSLRETDGGSTFLHYTADLDAEWAEAAESSLGSQLTVYRDADGMPYMARIVMPDDVVIIITSDELS